VTHPAEAHDPESDTAGKPATPPLALTREQQLAEIGALALASAKRLATDEKYRLAIQKMLV
jgi:hypothetical protein